MNERRGAALVWVIAAACSRPPAETRAPDPVAARAGGAVDTREAGTPVTPDAGVSIAPPSTTSPLPSAIAPAQAVDLLYTSLGEKEGPPDCDAAPAAAIRCLVAARYATDAAARDLATSLYARTGSVAGVEREHTMDGGYRGLLHLVPVLPVAGERVHLERVARSLDDFDAFFAELEKRGGAHVSYRWRDLMLRFFRSVKARTPSAYARGWTVAYNVDGSLNKTDASVRETMFHEIFHLNDAAHGTSSGDWSDDTLEVAYESVVRKCGTDTACLSKFAPNDTKVKGGTYYAFQPGNDVGEYAAELAVRYYREQRGTMGMAASVKTPFKCTGALNAKSWSAMVAEFFGGIDLTPSCP